jgi:hypothetical protein
MARLNIRLSKASSRFREGGLNTENAPSPRELGSTNDHHLTLPHFPWILPVIE